MTADAEPDEQHQLVARLDAARDQFLAHVEGISEDLARRAGVPSGRSLAGLASDLGVTERYWFGFVFAGGAEEDWRFGGEGAAGVPMEQLVRQYREAIEASNAIVSASRLDREAANPPFSEQHIDLRWVLNRVLQETTNFAGHAAVLRDQFQRLDAEPDQIAG